MELLIGLKHPVSKLNFPRLESHFETSRQRYLWAISEASLETTTATINLSETLVYEAADNGHSEKNSGETPIHVAVDNGHSASEVSLNIKPNPLQQSSEKVLPSTEPGKTRPSICKAAWNGKKCENEELGCPKFYPKLCPNPSQAIVTDGLPCWREVGCHLWHG